MRFYSITLVLFLLLFFFDNRPAYTQAIPKHSIIKPYPGSVLAKNMSKYQNFGELEMVIIDSKTKKKKKVKIQGKYWQLLWEVKTPKGDRVRNISKLEFFENFKNATKKVGGEVLYEDAVYLYLKVPRSDGGYAWCRIQTNAGLGQVYMNIVDEKPMTQSIIFGADEIKKMLDSDGRVLLYGILFDTDKADLKPESIKQLSAIVTLMLKYPALKLEIQGHTDNQGKPEYNLKLSQSRAETVFSYLKLFGISSNRLKAQGFGESKPVANNNTDTGRAKNRRVELVRF